VLQGINRLLVGRLLAALDEAGHSDGILVCDAHFPAARLGARVVDLPAVGAPEALSAICSVITIDNYDEAPGLDLMSSNDEKLLPIHEELTAAAGISINDARFVGRFEFYKNAATAFVIIRTGEVRTYGNVLVRKGLVTPLESARMFVR